jgi:hypothetical protein
VLVRSEEEDELVRSEEEDAIRKAAIRESETTTAERAENTTAGRTGNLSLCVQSQALAGWVSWRDVGKSFCNQLSNQFERRPETKSRKWDDCYDYNASNIDLAIVEAARSARTSRQTGGDTALRFARRLLSCASVERSGFAKSR